MFNTDVSFNKGIVNSMNKEEMRSPSPLSDQRHQSSLVREDQDERKTLEIMRPKFRKSSSSNSANSLKLAQLPHLETSIGYAHDVAPTEKKHIVNVNESLLETVKGNKKIPTSSTDSLTSRANSNNNSVGNANQSVVTSQPKTATVPASILASSSYPTPITPQLKTSTSTISFQVPNQKHRGSISARPSTTKVPLLDSPQTGIPSSRQPSVSSTTQAPLSRQASQSASFPSSTNTNIPNVNTSTPHNALQKLGSSSIIGANISRREDVRSPVQFDLLNGVSVASHITPNNKVSTGTNSNTTSSNHEIHTSPRIAEENNNLPTTRLLSAANSKLRNSSLPGENIYESKSGMSSTTSINGGNPNSNLSTPSSITKKKTLKTVVTPPVGPLVPFTQYLCKEDDDKVHILIGATGSVATIKIPMIIDKLFKIYGTNKVSIQLVVTTAAEHFLRGMKISSEVKIWREQEEWSAPVNKIKPGDPILHVELRKWADIFLIAPLSANTLAKIANGLADNLLTSIVRIWNPAVPILVAPAMNTFMYMHPITKIHLNILAEDFKFIEVLKPVEKVLVCGDIGMGGMREWSEVVDITVKKLKEIRRRKLELEKAKLDLIENGDNPEVNELQEKVASIKIEAVKDLDTNGKECKAKGKGREEVEGKEKVEEKEEKKEEKEEKEEEEEEEEDDEDDEDDDDDDDDEDDEDYDDEEEEDDEDDEDDEEEGEGEREGEVGDQRDLQEVGKIDRAGDEKIPVET
ncbi:hypothetical protein PICMEDRAFT_15832 [Pichia membranifaciens NRRL Y-2026]|uniref:Flavoprotein domain-containing protein n=1 Tax=Pichia membranifaciens NRRL Y-2026 TaxID=763406 RepID=A0A1E3NQI4_9ASCO|nr:hypothetical protein PICMEDRAFT_15832 [Pichia membranifaciens NRRL Y-2026]ODQ47968.1 hypothetical protein PICMEDRAFT_15832 [Pichia membranifaciens NRRL Y-2026]